MKRFVDNFIGRDPIEIMNKPFAYVGRHVYDTLAQGRASTTTMTKHIAFDDDVALFVAPQPAAQVEPPWESPDVPSLFKFINATPVVQSLLYDLNLLPEQINCLNHWNYMVSVCNHLAPQQAAPANAELVAALERIANSVAMGAGSKQVSVAMRGIFRCIEDEARAALEKATP